jgi:hypothetical protein
LGELETPLFLPEASEMAAVTYLWADRACEQEARMGNMTLRIDSETRDLVFDETGCFEKTFSVDTTVQNVRHTLVTWKAEFFADEVHGTDYERIAGTNQNDVNNGEIEEVIREAIFQEPEVSRIDALSITYDNRAVLVEYSATLKNGERISMEVRV